MEEIDVVQSKPEAFKQVQRWLAETGLVDKIAPAPSTSRAAELAVFHQEVSPQSAAPLAAKIYGLQILAENIEDNPEEHHAVLRPRQQRRQAHRQRSDKPACSLPLIGRARLVEALLAVQKNGVNLSMITSRPSTRLHPVNTTSSSIWTGMRRIAPVQATIEEMQSTLQNGPRARILSQTHGGGGSLMRKPFVAGNWKMNLDLPEARSLVEGIAKGLGNSSPIDVAICPPSIYLFPMAKAIANTPIAMGAQNCWSDPSGAFTGEVSAAMVKETGCTYVILGHSERRNTIGPKDGDGNIVGESNEMIAAKTRAVLDIGLTPIVCIGETLEQRDANETEIRLDGAALRQLGDGESRRGGQAGNCVRTGVGHRHRPNRDRPTKPRPPTPTFAAGWWSNSAPTRPARFGYNTAAA